MSDSETRQVIDANVLDFSVEHVPKQLLFDVVQLHIVLLIPMLLSDVVQLHIAPIDPIPVCNLDRSLRVQFSKVPRYRGYRVNSLVQLGVRMALTTIPPRKLLDLVS